MIKNFKNAVRNNPIVFSADCYSIFMILLAWLQFSMFGSLGSKIEQVTELHNSNINIGNFLLGFYSHFTFYPLIYLPICLILSSFLLQAIVKAWPKIAWRRRIAMGFVLSFFLFCFALIILNNPSNFGFFEIRPLTLNEDEVQRENYKKSNYDVQFIEYLDYIHDSGLDDQLLENSNYKECHTYLSINEQSSKSNALKEMTITSLIENLTILGGTAQVFRLLKNEANNDPQDQNAELARVKRDAFSKLNSVSGEMLEKCLVLFRSIHRSDVTSWSNFLVYFEALAMIICLSSLVLTASVVKEITSYGKPPKISNKREEKTNRNFQGLSYKNVRYIAIFATLMASLWIVSYIFYNSTTNWLFGRVFSENHSGEGINIGEILTFYFNFIGLSFIFAACASILFWRKDNQFRWLQTLASAVAAAVPFLFSFLSIDRMGLARYWDEFFGAQSDLKTIFYITFGFFALMIFAWLIATGGDDEEQRN